MGVYPELRVYPELPVYGEPVYPEALEGNQSRAKDRNRTLFPLGQRVLK